MATTTRHPLGLEHHPNAYTSDTADTVARFYTSRGWLNTYALACGYMEAVEVHGVRLTLYAEGCYHVRAHDHGRGMDDQGAGRLAWWSFDTTPGGLSAARSRFLRFARTLELMDDHPAMLRAFTYGVAGLYGDLARGQVPTGEPASSPYVRAPSYGPDDLVVEGPRYGVAGTLQLVELETDGGAWRTWADGTREYVAPRVTA